LAEISRPPPVKIGVDQPGHGSILVAADMVCALQDFLSEAFMRLHNRECRNEAGGSLTPGEWYNVYFAPGKNGTTGRQSLGIPEDDKGDENPPVAPK
jgi:hypothetical protein